MYEAVIVTPEFSRMCHNLFMYSSKLKVGFFRILASEQWHQDKSEQASDLLQLRKDKMQKVLRELEQEELTTGDSSFYGQLAFNEWLDKHGLPPSGRSGQPNKDKSKKTTKGDKNRKSSAPKSREEKTKAKVTAGPSEPTTGVKANSVSRGGKVVVDAGGDSNKMAESHAAMLDPRAKTEVVKKDDIDSDKKAEHSDTVFISPSEVDEKESNSRQTEKDSKSNLSQFENPNDWNKSCKVQSTFNDYMPRLSDAYPRDIFTMMPTKDATPHNLNIRHPKIFVTDEKERVRRADEVLNVRHRISQVNVGCDALGVDLDAQKRPVLYRCNAVQDLPRRRHVPEVMKIQGVCEGGMHLTDDVRSPLFKAGLVDGVLSAKSSDTSLHSTASKESNVSK